MCQMEKQTSVIVDPICGPLDINFSKSATSIILLTQMLIALMAFFTVQFSTWCLESVGSIRTFTTMALIVFWMNMMFLIVFVCNLPYKMKNINWLLLSFLQQLFGAFFILIAVIVLAINPCMVGQMIGVIMGVVLLLLYLLGTLLVYRNYNRPDRSTEPMDPNNADLPQVAQATRTVRGKIDDISAYISRTPTPVTSPKRPPPISNPTYHPSQPPPTGTTYGSGSAPTFPTVVRNNGVEYRSDSSSRTTPSTFLTREPLPPGPYFSPSPNPRSPPPPSAGDMQPNPPLKRHGYEVVTPPSSTPTEEYRS